MGLGSVALVPFAALYETLGACLVDDRATLLLYSLIHGNGFFLEYVLVRGDLDALLLPLLEMLYHAPRRAPNQIYMLLIILLILSQDASFNAAAHALVLPAIPWYHERMLRQTTLGSAIIIMLTRTVKYNLVQLRDVYLHTNCLAALANMAPHAANLSAYAAQRLVSLFEMLAKKYARLAQQAGVPLTWQPAETQGAEARTSRRVLVCLSPSCRSPAALPRRGTAPHRLSVDSLTGSSFAAPAQEYPSELSVYADFLRIVLEIINSILTYALPKNPEMIYALLHRQEVFAPFKEHPRFADLLVNIDQVLSYFNSRWGADLNRRQPESDGSSSE